MSYNPFYNEHTYSDGVLKSLFLQNHISCRTCSGLIFFSSFHKRSTSDQFHSVLTIFVFFDKDEGKEGGCL